MQRLLRILEFTAVTLLVVLLSTNAWAQATAQLDGRVTDESGAVYGRDR